MQWTRPKSVRQIGDIPGRGRIYMEDYVVRFARKLAKQKHCDEKAAMLLGNYYMSNGEKIYQISGIVEIENFAGRTQPELSMEMWDTIYSEIKENFTDLEIVGWFYTHSEFSSEQATRLLQIHKANFQHRDKVLYIYEEKEQEDSFFLYRNGKFEKQKGYYIYYEKNPEMLHYMEKENNRHVHIVEQEDDRVVRNIRGIMQEKEQYRRQQKKGGKWGYGIVGMVALIALLVGGVSLKNQNTLNQMKSQLRALQAWNQSQHSGGDRTTVETKENQLQKTTALPTPTTVSETVTGSALATPYTPQPTVAN